VAYPQRKQDKFVPKKKSNTKKVLAAVLAATALAGGWVGYQRYNPQAEGGQPRVDIEDVQPLPQIKLDTVPVYAGRVAPQAIDSLCELPGAKPVESQIQEFTQLQAFGGTFTRSLLSYAREAKIYTCFYNDASVASTFDPDNGFARINKTGDIADHMLQDLHATIHGYQHNSGALKYDSSWNLHSRISQKVASEALAQAGEFAAALEMSGNGNATLAAFHDKNATTGWQVFKDKYAQTADMQQASAAAVNALLRDPAFIASHANGVVTDYYNDYATGKVSRRAAEKFDNVAVEKMGEMPGGVKLAEGVTLPTQQEMATAVPELAKAFDIFRPGHEKQEFIGRIAPRIQGSGNRYTVLQAIARVDGDLTGQFNYAARPNIGGVWENCAQADYSYSQVPKATQDLWRNLQTLRKGEVMGKAIVEFSTRADVFHCYFSMSDSHAGEWFDNDGLVRISDKSTDIDYILTTQAHEVIHAAQRVNNLRTYDRSWRIADYQLMTLAHEGAARTGQMLVALELDKAGVPGPWKDMQSRFPENTKVIKAAYDAAITAGSSHADAMKAGGAAGWAQQFKTRDWADSYNQDILKDYITELVHGDKLAPNQKGYTLDRARLTGSISDKFNFTATLPSLPAPADRFGGNEQMRQAFEYVNLEHMARTQGRTTTGYKTELARLQADKNPYLGVDLSIIAGTLSNKDTTLSPLDAMNCFAGLSSGCTYGGKPLDAGALKIKMQ
jgi:hypothetical protein